MAEKRFEVSLPEKVLAGFGWEESEVPGKLREALVLAQEINAYDSGPS